MSNLLGNCEILCVSHWTISLCANIWKKVDDREIIYWFDPSVNKGMENLMCVKAATNNVLEKKA